MMNKEDINELEDEAEKFELIKTLSSLDCDKPLNELKTIKDIKTELKSRLENLEEFKTYDDLIRACVVDDDKYNDEYEAIKKFIYRNRFIERFKVKNENNKTIYKIPLKAFPMLVVEIQSKQKKDKYKEYFDNSYNVANTINSKTDYNKFLDTLSDMSEKLIKEYSGILTDEEIIIQINQKFKPSIIKHLYKFREYITLAQLFLSNANGKELDQKYEEMEKLARNFSLECLKLNLAIGKKLDEDNICDYDSLLESGAIYQLNEYEDFTKLEKNELEGMIWDLYDEIA